MSVFAGGPITEEDELREVVEHGLNSPYNLSEEKVDELYDSYKQALEEEGELERGPITFELEYIAMEEEEFGPDYSE